MGVALLFLVPLFGCSKLSPKSIATNGFSLFGNSALSAMGCELLINTDLTISPGVNYDTDLISCRSDVDVSGSGPVLSENSNPSVDPENILVRWREKTVNGVTKKILNFKGFTVVANWAKRYKVTVAAAEASVRVVSGNYILSDQLEVFDSKILGSGTTYACTSNGVSGYYTFKCPKGSLPKTQVVVTTQVVAGIPIPIPVPIPYCELWRVAPNAAAGITPQSVQTMIPSMTFPAGSLGIDRLSCISGTEQGVSVSLIPAFTQDGIVCKDVLGTASAPVAAPSALALSQFFRTAGASCATAAPNGGPITTGNNTNGNGTAAPNGGPVSSATAYPNCDEGVNLPSTCSFPGFTNTYQVHVENPNCWDGANCSTAAATPNTGMYFANPIQGLCKKILAGADRVFSRTCKATLGPPSLDNGWIINSGFQKCKTATSSFYYIRQGTCYSGDLSTW